MKTVLVAGGAGEVGEGIVRQLLASGHRVLVQSRRLKKIQEMAERLGQPTAMIPIPGDIQSERDMESLLDAVGDTELELDSVVASIGSWWSGPNLIDLDLTTYEHVMHERLTTHFLLAKTFLKELQDRAGSSYLFIHSAA
jgi:3-oxoacyl-[acyl-carrier protein] reductase